MKYKWLSWPVWVQAKVVEAKGTKLVATAGPPTANHFLVGIFKRSGQRPGVGLKLMI